MNPVFASHGVWRIAGTSVRVHGRGACVAAALCVLALLLAICELLVGTMPLSPTQVFEVLLGQRDGGIVERIVLDIRLPRASTALFAGAALGISGAIFQSVSRNALGSPDVIGFTVGAATGAIAQIRDLIA